MAEPTIIQIDNLTTQHQPADASFSFSLAQLYDSLPVDEGHIRILDLEPEPRHRLQGRARQPVVPPLRGTLRIVSLEDRPDFVALSYVWGSKADPPDLLLCNGCKIEITSNCKDALQAVQRSQGPVTIWVDAICINQKDNTEKASQIPNMEDIYTWARMVYVWLGPGDEHTDSIMKTLREASHRGICLEGNRIRHLDCKLAGRGAAEDSWTLCMQDLKDCWVYVRWVNPLLLDVSRLASPLLVLANYLPCQGERNYAKSLDSLLSRPWVNRAWTFQELILAQDITLMCGEQLLSWDRFVRGLWIWGYHHRYYHGFHHVYTLTQLPSFHRYRLHYKGPDLDHPKMKYFREWYAMVTLWMNIRRKATWRTHKMRCEHAGRATMNNHQSPILLEPFPQTKLANPQSHHRIPLILPKSLSLDGMAVITSLRIIICLISLLIPVGGAIFLPIAIAKNTKYLSHIIASASLPLLIFLLNCFLITSRQIRAHFAVGNRNDSERDDVDELISILPQVMKYRSSTEPRDRVYAIYGILRSFDIPLSEIDYTKSEGQVYLDFYSDLLRSSPKHLIFIIDAGLSGDMNIPSWVPNWETALERSWLPSNIYSSPRSEVEVAIGATHVELAGKTLQIRGMIVCQVGFATETFEKIEHDDSDDELVVKLETRVATLCQLIHRARDLPFNAAYKTIAESILQTINGFKPENQPLEASDRVFEPDNGQLADPRRGPRFVRLGHVTESSDSVLQRDAEQFESSSSFSNLYKNIRATLNGVGDAQIDYLAVSMAVLQRHIPPLEYSAIADLCDKFAKRRLFDTLTGYLGLGPPGMRAGDFVAIVAGVPVPMVFRGTGSIDTYLVIGPAFVLGLMGKPDLDLSSVKDLNLV